MVKLSALNSIRSELIDKEFDISFPDDEHFRVSFGKSKNGVWQYLTFKNKFLAAVPIDSVPEEQLLIIKSKLKEVA